MHISNRRGAVRAVVAALGTLAVAAAASATEPIDNNFPWMGPLPGATFKQMEVVNSYQGAQSIAASGPAYAIGTTTDVDYYVGMCGGQTNVKKWRISFTHANGDLDIRVYRADGLLLGSSTGVGNEEIVDVASANEDAAVMKVYGFSGAQGSYGIQLFCS
jgi:hypothetical protein